MITIEPISLGIGAGAMLILWIGISLIKKSRKPKYDWTTLINLVQESGTELRSAYIKLQELGNIFNDMQLNNK